MANELDELNDPINEAGREVNVIQKQLHVKASKQSHIIKNVMWAFVWFFGISYFVYTKKERKCKKELQQLQQKLQRDASQIDNYMEQRVVELKNAAKLLDKAIDLDKDTLTKIAMYRGGSQPSNDETRNEVAQTMDNVAAKINVALENYPDLAAHQEIADCMQKNSYLQREITAAREQYNDTVFRWNALIYEQPYYDMISEKEGYTTRIPFAASKEIKDASRDTFF